MKCVVYRICFLFCILTFLLVPFSQVFAAQSYPVPSYGAQPVLQKLENRIPIVIAHKADWRNFPEISLLAINSSINMGVDMVEVDVNVTKDGVVVLVHDENIRRMTNATTAITVSSLTWNELKKYALEPEMGNKGTNYILTSADAKVLNAIPSYKTYVGTAVSGGTMPFARFDTALELINKRCLVVLDKLTTAERFAACYQVVREADMLEYVLFKNSLDVAGMAEWYTAAASKWNTAHPNQTITAQDVKTSIRYECCTTNRSTLQAHINDGVNLTSVSVGITDANEASLRNTFIPWCEARNIAIRCNTGEGLGASAGIDSQLGWAKALDIGCTEIMTDHPAELVSYLQTVYSTRAATSRIEAEHFTGYSANPTFTLALEHDSQRNKRVENLANGEYLVYHDIVFDGTESILSAYAAGKNASLEFYLDEMTGSNCIATLSFNSDSYAYNMCAVNAPMQGKHTLYVKCIGTLSVDSYCFTDGLFFGFENSEVAQQRYQSPVYGNLNFDTANWLARTATMTAVSYDKSAGTISSTLSTGGNHYIQTGASTSARPLRYLPQAGDYLQMRLRIDNAVANDSATAMTAGIVFSGQGCGDFDYTQRVVTSITQEQIDAGFFTVTLPLSKAFTEASEIQALRLYLTNLASAEGQIAKITVDYIYIGTKSSLPEQQGMYFDFTDTPKDAIRYSTNTYGGVSFDSANWTERSATMQDLWFNRTNHTMQVTLTSGGNHYIQTGKNVSARPLHYQPMGEDYLQIRLKMDNVTAHSTSSDIQLGLVFSGEGCGDFDYAERAVTAVDPMRIDNGYFTVTIPLNDAFRSAKEIQAFRLYLMNMASKEGTTARITIDYIYIGDKGSVPTPMYTVTFKNADGTTLATQSVHKGESASYTGATPTKAYDTSNHYTFKGWDKTLTSISSNLTVTAQFTATAHSYTYSKVDATNHKATCSCGYSKTATHTWNSGAVTKAATCTATGVKTYTCNDCKTTKTETLAKLGHSYTTKVTAPTCTAQGYTTHTCSRCSDSYKDTYVEATGHSYTYAATKAPTTSATGTLTGTCSKCSNTTNVTLPKLDTTNYSYSVVKAATCAVTGTGRYTWKTTTYGSFYFDVSIAKTTTHSYNSGVITTQPTCTATGVKTYTCSVCKGTKTETVAAKGHTEVIDKAVAATCTTAGKTEGKHCSVCNEVRIAQQTVPAKGHTEVIDEAVEATCTKTGLTEGKHCETCGEILVARGILDALGHSPINTDNGDKTHTVTCENCDFSEVEACVYENGECICGAKEVLEPTYDSALQFGHSLTLENDISINFIGRGTQLSAYDTFYLECKVPVYNGNELVGYETVNIDPVFNGTNYEFTLLGITAKMMNNEIEAVFRLSKDGQEYYSKTDVYSVAEYAYGKLDSTKATDTDELKAICANLLRYGAMAQTQFGYRTDALVDASMTTAHKAFLTKLETVEMNSYMKQLDDHNAPTVLWKSATLELGNKVIMCLIANLANYNGDVSKLTMRLTFSDSNGAIITEERPLELYSEENKTYAVSYDGLRATEMRSVVSASIYNGETRVSKTVEYSIESYGARSSDAAMQELCLAMLAYGDSANIYFAN